MSHGSNTDEKCEPNLVPMLDMVLQLVMFFMVCANFVMEQVNDTIKLPTAIAAKPLDAKAAEPIFLNIDKKGVVLLSGLQAQANGGRERLENPLQVQNFLRRQFELDLAANGGDRTKPPRSSVILRADQEASFEHVYGIMKAVRLAGYQQVQLRAIRFGGQLEG
jgi:biopolymer transport protein ExbD